MQTKQEVLQACTVEGMTVKLPGVQLERKLYQETAKYLELIGGKWNRGKAGFVFNEDPTALLSQISNGEKRNLKKEFQFFPTPPHLAETLVEYADINSPDLMVLEPSAGQGSIVKALLNKESGLCVHSFELMGVNRTFLAKIQNLILLGEDFLKDRKYYQQFDRIVANPPFTKNQDIDHIIQMYLCCKKGGKIVTIAGKHWQHASEKKCQQFREWLQELNAEIIEIKAREFKESGTNIATCIIIINK